MRIDAKHVFLTTVALTTSLLHAVQIGGMIGGEGKLSLGNGLNLSNHANIDFDGLYAKARLNVTAGDMESVEFNNQSAFRTQILGTINGTMQAQFMDDMAEIRVFRPRQDHSVSQWALHRLVGAREINTTGTTSLALFDTNGSSWSQPEEGMINGINCTVRQINAFFKFVNDSDVKVPVNVTAYIFNNDYTLTFKGENITASMQSVKFTYSIGSWPFANNSLGLSVFGLVKSTGTSNMSASHGVVVSGSANVMIPTAAETDGVEVNITANLQSIAANINAGSAMVIELSFPVYATSLVYDPVFGMEDEEVTTAPASTSAVVNATTSAAATTAPATTAPVDGGVSSVAVSVMSTVLMLAMAMITA